VDPASPSGAADWELWALTYSQVQDMLPVVIVVTTTTGMAIGGSGASFVSSVVCTTVGYASVSKRITFLLAFSDNGAATVTFSGDKIFLSAAKTIQISEGTAGVSAHGVVTSANVITVTASGVTGGSGIVYVTVDGY
jgi:hypothetical protein